MCIDCGRHYLCGLSYFIPEKHGLVSDSDGDTVNGKEIAITALVVVLTLALIGSQANLRTQFYSSTPWF